VGCSSAAVGNRADEDMSRRRLVLGSVEFPAFFSKQACSLLFAVSVSVCISTSASYPQAHATRPFSTSQPHDNAMVPALEAHPSCIHASLSPSHLVISHLPLISPDFHSKQPSRTHPSAPTGSNYHLLRLWIAQIRTARTPGSRPCSGRSRRLCRR
jgi:hypothetical protein